MKQIPEQAILEELNRLIACKVFSGSGRAREFLKYIVTETLAGNQDKLKGYTIGVEVFKREDDFDPEKSSIVRVEAQRLRHLLERYYLGDGRFDSVRIDLPKGRYVPVFVQQQSPGTAESRREASIAVLPLRNLSGDPDQQYISDGLTEELIQALGRYPEMSVMSSHATTGMDPARISPQQSGQVLGVCFLLGGSSQTDKQHIRINTELIDVSTGKQIWSKSYKRPFTPDDLYDVEEEVSGHVVSSIADRYQGAIPRTLSKPLLQRPVENPSSYEALLYLHHYIKAPSMKSYRAARLALEKAALEDPDQPMVQAALGEVRLDGYAHFGMERDKEVTINMALQCVNRSRDLDPECDYCYWVEGQAWLFVRDPERVLQAAESILHCQPPPSMAAMAGWLLALAGEWERGLGILQDQMDILRYFPKWLHHAFFLDAMRHGDYDKALKSAQAFTDTEFIWGPLERAAALGMLGHTREAAQQFAEVNALRPDFKNNPRPYLECYIMQDELVDIVLEGLSHAGMPRSELRLVK